MKHIGFLLAVAGLSITAAQGAATPSAMARRQCSTDPALSKLVAASDVVVVGNMTVSEDELHQRAAQASPGYVDITVAIGRTIKGASPGHAIIRFNPRDAFYEPGNAAMVALDGKSALLFLQQVDGQGGGLYFAGNTPLALQPASPENVARIEGEVTQQAGLLRNWHADPTLAHYREVRDIIAKLGHVRGAAQQHLFDRLVALGSGAVPAIIAQMDDRRALPDQQITLKNTTPDRFEAARFYGPEKVVDALDAILNQLTGESFGSIENGGSDRERSSAVAGWRIYASALGCK